MISQCMAVISNDMICSFSPAELAIRGEKGCSDWRQIAGTAGSGVQGHGSLSGKVYEAGLNRQLYVRCTGHCVAVLQAGQLSFSCARCAGAGACAHAHVWLRFGVL